MTEDEKEILNYIVEGWIDADAPLPGCYSYQDVATLLKKLGIDVPKWLKDQACI